MKNMLNCRMLAEATGRTPASIKNIASQIPGSNKDLGIWVFPESAIKWVNERKSGAPCGKRNGRWNGGNG